MRALIPLLAILMTAGLTLAEDQQTLPSSPPSIAPGMTIDQVVAVLGEPEKIADLGAKQIYVYKTLRVTFVDGVVPPVADSTVTVPKTVDPLPYELGLGGVVAVAAAFLLGRMSRPANKLPPAPPAPPPNPIRPTNLIRRLDELEQLMDLGVLTPEEFEAEKDKLRNSA
jgi:hypothetical protein